VLNVLKDPAYMCLLKIAIGIVFVLDFFDDTDLYVVTLWPWRLGVLDFASTLGTEDTGSNPTRIYVFRKNVTVV
jgi:hypothetical protein